MPVDAAYQSALEGIADQLKRNVEAILAQQGITHAELQARLGFRSPSGYWKMYSNGTLDLRKVVLIATALNVEPDRILLGTVPAGEVPRSDVLMEPTVPYAQRPKFLEERVAFLESEVRKLKEQQRPK